MNTPNPFCWGIVGTGGIARQFADDLRLVPDARLAAVCSRTIDGAMRFAGESDATPYASLREMLSSPDVDAVYLATPNHVHAPQALDVIAARKPVLIEKPVATSSADAAMVFDAARRRGVMAMEAIWTRFLPAVEKVACLVRDGAIGSVRSVEAELSYKRDPGRDARFFDRSTGGGAAFDLGVYPLSLALMMLGQPLRTSGRWFRGPGDVDIRTEFDLDFRGASARLACGIDRDGENAFTILGTKGAIRIHPPFLKAQRITVFGRMLRDIPMIGAARPAQGTTGKILSRLPLPGRRRMQFEFTGNGLQFEAQAFAEAVRRGKTSSEIAPPDHSIAVLQAIEAVLSQPPAN